MPGRHSLRRKPESLTRGEGPHTRRSARGPRNRPAAPCSARRPVPPAELAVHPGPDAAGRAAPHLRRLAAAHRRQRPSLRASRSTWCSGTERPGRRHRRGSDKEPVLAKESVSVALPFATAPRAPRLPLGRGSATTGSRAGSTRRRSLPGACNEWFTTQYGVVVDSTAGGPAVAWCAADAPLLTVGDVVRGTWAERFEPPAAPCCPGSSTTTGPPTPRPSSPVR